MILTLAALAGLCTPPTPAVIADPEDAIAYAAAGDEARAAGDLRIAAIAYRNAIASDPKNAHAMRALRELCEGEDADGTTKLDAAIARFRANEDAEARHALEAIVVRDPTDASAQFFLGLLALRRHDGGLARSHFAIAGRDPDLAQVVAPMVRLAKRDGRVVLSALLQGEHDTNPELIPGTPPAGVVIGSPQPDQSATFAATIIGRPVEWLAIKNATVWRNQRVVGALDFFGENAQLEMDLRAGANRIAARYDFDYDRLDGSAYLVAHRAGATYLRQLGDAAIEIDYAIRRRDYQRASERDFTGWVHTGELAGAMHVGTRVDLELRAIARREITLVPAFAHVGIGGVASARVRPTDRTRMRLAVGGRYATYDDADLQRDDRTLVGELDLEVDVSDRVLAVAGVDVVSNDSSVEDFRYTKLVARLGVAFAIGGP